MGHQRLGILRSTRPWRAVVALITGGASAATVAAAVAREVERQRRRADGSPGLCQAFLLLTQIPLAARQSDFGAALRKLDLAVTNVPTLIDISSAMMGRLDDLTRASGRPDDLSEMSSKAAVESLIAMASQPGQSLFGASYAADEARSALRGLSTDRQFGLLTRDFMARITRHTLDYFLSRLLPDHVGQGRRLESLRDHQVFDTALGAHCRETAFIVEDYASDWYSKTNFEGGITLEKATTFIHVALGKMLAELRVRGQTKVPVDA